MNIEVILRTVAAATALTLAALPLQAQKQYDTGASDTEIKIGNMVPYSGPVSAYGTIGKTMAAYMAKINAEGGVNGRKITFISYDDAYSPPKTVEQTRKLVEQDGVLAVFFPIGTPSNLAIQKYLNTKKVPQLFVGTGASRWGNIKEFPWTIGWQPTYSAEAKIYGRLIVQNNPTSKVAVLMQNDDFGKDFYKGLQEGLGEKVKDIVLQTYETADPTVDSQLLTLKNSGADVLVLIVTPRFGAIAIKKVAELGWKPTRYLSSVSAAIASVLIPAGADNAKGVFTMTYLRDPKDPETLASKEYAEYAAFLKQYAPDLNPQEGGNVTGYSAAQTLVQTLKQAGDNLTRENIMKQALNLNLTLPMLYPGIVVKTSPTNAYPIESLQLFQFDGTKYVPIGPVSSGH
jgi:ABC-type branched-subunit amino acid transport system substrate-binding protein